MCFYLCVSVSVSVYVTKCDCTMLVCKTTKVGDTTEIQLGKLERNDLVHYYYHSCYIYNNYSSY